MSAVCDETLASTYFAPSCFPNNFFTPDDVEHLPGNTVRIDLSRCDGSPPLSPSSQRALEDEIFGSDSSDSAGEDEAEQGYAPLDFEPIRAGHTFSNVLSFALQLLNNEALAANFGALLSGPQPHQTYPRPAHVYEQLENGKFALRSHFRRLFQERLITCATTLLLALNDQPLHREEGSTVVSTVPDDALSEVGISFPVIAVVLAQGWELGHREFDTVGEVEEHAGDVTHALRYSVALFGLVIVASFMYRADSVCNPGAAIGLSRAEFVNSLGDSHPDMLAITYWLERLLFNGDVMRRTDLACARLFNTQPVAWFMTVEHDGIHTLIPRVKPGVLEEEPPRRLPCSILHLGHYLAATAF
ncbi:hypothetical protein B0H14DRAFT_3781683 [Mycena olivaceomarginata]|nr:hypothetical protein B0H14DRAFT_3781683 [Mycena olivaceomarginata]